YERYGVTVNVIAPRARTAMTEAMPMFAAPERGFDVYDPANVSPVVAWLASDAAAGISGQVLIVIGGSVQLLATWPGVGSIAREDRWTVDDLVAAAPELFGDRPSGVPAFGG